MSGHATGARLLAPESDPGIVSVTVTKGKATVRITYAGPDITDHPRDLDLPIPVERLFDIANDRRIGGTTSQDTIDGADGLAFWEDRPVG